MSKKHKLFLVAGLSTMLFACKNDKFEDIHPGIYDAPCDTTAMTYTKDIKPLLEIKCGATDVSCHKASPNTAINLDNYIDVKDQATNTSNFGGDLWGTITWGPNNHKMPKNSAEKLDVCSTNKILDWLNRNEPQ